MLLGHEPDWRPLLKTAGEEVTRDFMWMFAVELSGGKRLDAYKHVETRCYVSSPLVGISSQYLGL